MHFTREADYAVRIVAFLSAQEKRIEAKRIAEETQVTLRFSLKILNKLVGGDLVRSYKGAHGGYELAKESKEISLRDVVEVIEGPIHVNRCLADEGYCCNAETCVMRKSFCTLNNLVNETLASQTFDMYAENYM